ASLQPPGRLEIEHEDLSLQQRRVHPLSLAGGFALEQRDHDAKRAEQTGGQIGNRDADADWPLSRQAGDRHQAAHTLRDLIEARPVAIRTVLTKARNAGEDNALVHLAQGFIVDTETVFHIGTEILDHDIGLLNHALERTEPLRRFQIKRDAALVAMQVLKVGTVAWSAWTLAFFQMRRRLDLDDVGTPITELPDARGARAYAGEIKDGEAGKGLGGPGKRHLLGSEVSAFSPKMGFWARQSPICVGLSIPSAIITGAILVMAEFIRRREIYASATTLCIFPHYKGVSALKRTSPAVI